MSTSSSRTLRGTVVHLIFSPKGAYEGVLLDTAKGPAQVVFTPEDGVEMAAALTVGAAISLRVRTIDDDRPSVHKVYELAALPGGSDKVRVKHGPVKVTGAVARLNYSRRGEVNGAVLKSGDFVHSKPQGATAVGFAVGQTIQVEGEARPMRSGSHRVIEAAKVNGVAIKAKGAKKAAAKKR